MVRTDIESESNEAHSWSEAGDCWRVEDVRGLSRHALDNVESCRNCVSAASEHLRQCWHVINEHTFQQVIEGLTRVTTQSAADTAEYALASSHSCQQQLF